MLKYQQSLHKSRLHTQLNTTSTPSTQLTSTSTVATWSQALGCTCLHGLNVRVRHSSSSLLLVATSSGPELALAAQTPQAHQEPEPTVEEIGEWEAHDLADDKRAVDHELGQYEEDGVSTFMPLEHMTDLVHTWEVSLYVHLKIMVLSYFGFLDQWTYIPFIISCCNGCSSCTGIGCAMWKDLFLQ